MINDLKGVGKYPGIITHTINYNKTAGTSK